MVRRRRRYGPVLLTPAELDRMREVGQFAASLLDLVEPMIQPGVTTEAIDRAVHEATRARGAISAPYLYPPGGDAPFPKHCCTSVNEVIVHGIPDSYRLRDGDIVSYLTSGNYGHALGASIGMGYVPVSGESGAELLTSRFEIEVAGIRR